MLEQKIKGKNKEYFGIRKSDHEKIFIYKPTWDCGWYWSFGHLGNSREHYHLKDYHLKTEIVKNKDNQSRLITLYRNKNMYDVLKEDYNLNKNIEKHLWLFCELATTAYTLKETAELLFRGGSYYANNPLKDIIQNEAERDRINKILLPAIFNKINDIYEDKIESA